jgi:succinate dehydrogenase / fumarate reductase, cytochrome b subunit
MAETTTRQRPGTMRLTDAITGYKYPLAAIVSILHRGSGMLMFFLLPVIVYLFDVSLTSEISYMTFTSVFTAGIGFLPGWFFKLVALALIWSYLHHFIAGLRHLYMDATHTVSKEFGRQSSVFTIGVSVILTIALGAKLFFF